MIVLGIETSCDDTAAAVVVNGRKILSNVATSQAELHARYGGIVPELASRSHVQAIVGVVRAALAEADLTLPEIDAIAVTSGPGLAGSLIVGLNMAKGLAAASGKPLIGVNHLQGHAYAAWLHEAALSEQGPPSLQVPPPAPEELAGFPLLCLVVSGGHTDLALLKDHGEFERIGRTRDDAAGEAFDKAARLMGLGYPGGPIIQKVAENGGPSDPLPRAWIPGTWDFSFSGLKTAVLHRARAEGIYPPPDGGPDPEAVAALARSFQDAVADVISTKTARAAAEFGVCGIVIGGGVAANSALRKALNDRSDVPVISPPPALCTDNGAMIAAAAYRYLERGETSGWDLDVKPGLTIEEAPSAPAATPV